MSPLGETQRHGHEFVARNVWLHLLLGLESWGRRFDALLAAHAPAGGARGPAATAPGDERLIDFVLGVAAARDRLRRHLAAAAGAPGRTHAPPPVAAGDGWLR